VLAKDKNGAVGGIEIRAEESMLRISESTAVFDQQGEKPGRIRSLVIPAGGAGGDEAEKGIAIGDNHGVDICDTE
jgi:hypothetical protein